MSSFDDEALSSSISHIYFKTSLMGGIAWINEGAVLALG